MWGSEHTAPDWPAEAVWGRWGGGALVTEMPKEVTLLGSKFRQRISGMEWTPHPRRAAHGAMAGLGVHVQGVRGLESFRPEPRRHVPAWLCSVLRGSEATGWPWGVDGDR